MRRIWAMLFAAAMLLATLSVVPTPADAFTFCGADQNGVQLRFHNPDLNPWNDPVPEDHPYHDSELPFDPALTESSWQFFIQFQAVVNTTHSDSPSMDEIESFWFAFGPIQQAAVSQETPLGPGDNCERPWLPGFQLYSYRGDADPSDGFHVPINTTGVPDGTYGAAVFACSATTFHECWPTSAPGEAPTGQDEDLIAAGWTRATVFNNEDTCEDDPQDNPTDPREWGTSPAELRCERSYDFIEPWPKVLPGDGDFPTSKEPYASACNDPQQCVTVEFAESIRDIEFTFNGVDKTAELEPWSSPPRYDNDLILGNDDGNTDGQIGHSDCSRLAPIQDNAPSEDARVCQKVVWGDAFVWQAPREFRSTDEIRISATDFGNNTANKIISFEDASKGGVIELIEANVEISVDETKRKIRPGDAKIWTVTLQNEGQDTAHIFPTVNDPPEVDAIIADDHIDVEGGSSTTVSLQAGPKANASEGEYPVPIEFQYITGNRRKVEKIFPVVVADNSAELSAGGGGGGGNNNGSGDGDQQTVEPLGEGFVRQCQTRADFEVCFVSPETLQADSTFTAEVQVAEASEDRTERHEVDAGQASLEIQYLTADQSEQISDSDTFEMEQKSVGQYRTDVTLSNLAPTINAVFDSEKVQASAILRQPTEADGEAAGELIPGFEMAAVVAAAGVAAYLIRKD